MWHGADSPLLCSRHPPIAPQAGAQPNKRTAENCRPLHLAAGGGHVGAAWALVRGGASLTARNKAGQTPLEVATPAVRAALCP